MDSLIRWSLKNRLVVLLTAVVVLFVGGYTASRMPVDVFPDLTAPTVTVITEARGMSPTEVETQITFPIETALNGATGVRRVRSATAVGISVVWTEFEWGTDIRSARQIVSEKVALVANELPPEVERPILAPVSSIMGEILFLALTSTNHSPLELRNFAETGVRRRLLAVPGVSQVIPLGGGEKQFQAVLAQTRLQQHNVALNDVLRALTEANENVSAGILNERGSEWLVTGVGRVRSLDDIASTVVRATDGVPVLIGQLGEVRIGEAPKRGEGSANGTLAVILGVQKQPGANTLELTRRLDTVLDDIASKLPSGMKLQRDIFRQADFIQVAVGNVQRALLEGIVFVIVVVLVFLANTRATLISVTAIPLSLAVAVLALKGFGATINTMTLGGMAIAIGALVDDAVIDVENVFRRLRENSLLPESQRRPAFTVVLDASVEIRGSIVFATFIIALVFVPVFFLSGVEGRLLQPLGVAFLVALMASLFVAVTVTPAMCLWLLPRSKTVREGHEPRVVRALKSAYARVLVPAMNHPWRVSLPTLVLLVAALAVLPFFGRGFLPDFNEGTLTVSAVTLPGTSLAESDELGRLVEKTLLSHPEVVNVARRTGRAELDEHAQGVEAAELDVSLKMGARSKAEFLAALRESLSLVPGVNITLGQPISHRIDHMLSGTRANVAVKLFGPDLYKLRELGAKVRDAANTVPGAVDVTLEQQVEVPTLRVKFDRPALARHGLTIREVARYLEAAVQGVTVSRVLEGQRVFDLVVKVDGGEPWRTDELGRLLIRTPAGPMIPLSTLAIIAKETGPNTISREQVERKIVVSCNVAGRDVTSVVRDLQKLADPILGAAPGYRVEYGGQFESAAEANRLLFLVSTGVIIAIMLLLYLVFGSARDAAIILLNLPFALIGGVLGVWWSGGVLNVASMIGFITVFGISTRNGIMLLTHIHHLQRVEGVSDFTEAVRRGAMERLAPILMTALAAAFALIPLALGGGKPGNEIQTPMATVILCGLLTSLPLDLLIAPALYRRWGQPRATPHDGSPAV
jgi:CzcA family heavy metal efflux pump